ncbi:hypothetical protein GCM10009730_62050 [Streptomyces albidochromogenes]
MPPADAGGHGPLAPRGSLRRKTLTCLQGKTLPGGWQAAGPRSQRDGSRPFICRGTLPRFASPARSGAFPFYGTRSK